jgi:hypothetical protein
MSIGMNSKDSTFRQLAQKLDELPSGYPETKTGVEIKILKKLFSEEECKIALNLSSKPEQVEKISKRVDYDH